MAEVISPDAPPGKRSPAMLVRGLYDSAFAARSNFHSRWQRIADYALANRDFTTEKISQGRSRQRRIFATQFQEAHEQYVSAIQALMIPEGANWEVLVPHDIKLMDRVDVRRHYEAISQVQMASYQNPAGQFYRAAGTFIYDYAGFGNGGALFADWDDEEDTVRWIAWPLEQTFYITNAQNRVVGFIRRHDYTARQAVDAFGADNVDPEVKRESERATGSSSTTSEYTYLELIHPANKGPLTGIQTDAGHPWICLVMGLKENRLVKEPEGYWEQPIFAIRHTLNVREDYGRGPADRALPDQRTANAMFKDMLDRSQLDLHPPLAIPHRGLMSPVRQFPRGQTVYQPSMFTGSVPPIFPLNPSPGQGSSIEMFQLVINQIRQAFLWDLLQPFDERYMSATQIIELAARTTQLLGPNFSGMRVDWFQPQSRRVYGLNRRHGKLPPTPMNLRGLQVHVQHRNPAMVAQMAPEVNSQIAFTQWLNEQAAAQGNSDVYDNVDLDEIVHGVAAGLQIPAKALRSRAERNQIRAGKNQAAEAQADVAEFATVAQAAGQAAPALKVLQGGAGGGGA